MTKDHRKPELAAVQELLLDEANFLRPSSSGAQRGSQGLWRWLASRFDARRLVFIEESGFHTSITRLRASRHSAAPAPGS
jgi:hypothetical protein